MPFKDPEKRKQWYEDYGRQLKAKDYEENKEYHAEMGKIWRDKNKEKIQIRKKKYYDDHEKQISEHRKIKVTCGCGSTYCMVGKSRHDKTQKHVIYIIEKMHDDNKLVQERTNHILAEWGELLRDQ